MSATRLLARFDGDRLARLCVTAWLVLSIAGLWWLFQHVSTPGANSAALADWPVQTSIERQAGAATLVMFVHPRCPCTRASLAELERVVARSGGAIHPRIVLSLPVGATDEWRHTQLRHSAERIPGAVLIDDVDGREALLFGAAISGTTLLYDFNGKLTFQGGITAGRGHQGDNAGENAVLALLREGTVACREMPTFGCPIQSPVSNDQASK
jgi:hypothetical protein